MKSRKEHEKMKAERAIEKMLVANIRHIRPQTAEWLTEGGYQNMMYEKRDGDLYGWFLSINLDEPDSYTSADIPDDLRDVFAAAAAEHCWWVCLDPEGFEIDSLLLYDWD